MKDKPTIYNRYGEYDPRREDNPTKWKGKCEKCKEWIGEKESTKALSIDKIAHGHCPMKEPLREQIRDLLLCEVEYDTHFSSNTEENATRHVLVCNDIAVDILQLFQATIDEIEAAMPREKEQKISSGASLDYDEDENRARFYRNGGHNFAVKQQQAVFKQYKEEQLNELH